MLGAEGVHSTWATGASLQNRALSAPKTIARPRPLSVLQPRSIPRRDGPRRTEAPAQRRPRRWDPRASRSRPRQHRRPRAGRRPAPLQGPTASRASGPALHAGCPPYAHALPRAHPLGSHGAAVPTSPLPGSQRPPARPPSHPPTDRVFRAPRRLPCREAAAPGAPEARGAPDRARCCRAKSLPSRGPGASAWSWFLQQATARAARARLVR